VNLSGYTVGNDETISLFLKGFENARDVLGGILSPPIPVTYYAIKERAISVTKSRQLINTIQQNALGGFGVFRPAQNQLPPRRGNYPPRPQNQYGQRQYNSTNAPPWPNNIPVPMDTSARTRPPPYWGRGYSKGRGGGQRTYGNVAQLTHLLRARKDHASDAEKKATLPGSAGLLKSTPPDLLEATWTFRKTWHKYRTRSPLRTSWTMP